MAIYYRQVDDIIIVSGKTYPYKDIIKSCGGRFQGGDKVWAIPINDAALTEIKALCKRVGGGPLKIQSPHQNKQPQPKAPVSADEPGSVKVDGLSISELMTRVHLHIQQGFPRAEWVIGEIQSLSRRHTGTYLQLADFKEGASKSATMTVNATLWRSTQEALNRKLKESLDDILQEGMKIRALVQVGFYKDRGSISLNILDIDPNFTKGALALAREKLLKELRSQGLDRKNKQLEGSIFPFKIGLLSAEGSRAKSDFLDQLRAYGFPGQVAFIPSQMQGEKTVEAVIQGIKRLEQMSCDYIVITRGGGSNADLRWFDDRGIAMAVAHSDTPIVAAIGHHDDICIAEEIAFRREKTPTAAADFILSCFATANERLQQGSQRLLGLATEILNQKAQQQIQLSESLRSFSQGYLSQMSEHITYMSSQIQAQYHRSTQSVEAKLNQQARSLAMLSQKHVARHQQFAQQVRFSLRERINSYINTLERGIDQSQGKLKIKAFDSINRQEQMLQQHYTFMVAKDPTPWLKQGWTQLVQNQKQIKRISDLDQSQPLQTRLLDGRLHLTIQSIEKDI
ncbi:exodeoxyribonuclease VII large subunit [Pseudobacteriovorax antillogorgiicola]|uniref:Exodeoxyribonuclease VII large subunit n=1 Tax=Pseudobacteriovorax antillogorgiicola TaxID=1513793 RepID=A0A1Y6BPN6_9BACT|nr:exodeoxyribonuclease VII large subunit [Pseudobacteriovorax antillogorgiicola]TCS53830.1 exodeoxyribonuclease VII large subunit [Pseudobacteriovorax antillogorgiicola]SMF21774.1 Exodeoxyribonuclease VII large subunit [Pseudobacteriovorax antillogorgiicola]